VTMSGQLGLMRCTQSECGGTLGASGQEVTRLICQKCGQNYQMVAYLKPVDPIAPVAARLLPPSTR